MISFAAALDIIARSLDPLPAVQQDCPPPPGWSNADSLVSPASVPPFANAAMDGFALRSADTQTANPDKPLRLVVAGSLTAGENPTAGTAAGSCWEIMTGAPMPAGCDAVVPVERVEIEHDAAGKPVAIVLKQALAAGRNRREAGEDFTEGGPLLAAGRMLDPPAIMALAATGISRIAARPAPRIAIITTGNELAGPGALRSGLIRDSNRPYLEAMTAALQLPLAASSVVGDDRDTFISSLRAALEQADLVITTGGVSAGRMDFVPGAIQAMGGEILFHKVAIRPGKPLLFARVGSKPVFGLPGNPIAAAVGMRFFTMPALRILAGQTPESWLSATAAEDIRGRQGFTFFAKGRAWVDVTSRLLTRALPGQESFKISPLVAANCWTIIEAGQGDAAAGDLVRVAPLLPGNFPASTG